MNNRLITRVIAPALMIGGFGLAGCSGSDESTTEKAAIHPSQPSATEAMQHDIATMRSANDSLLILVNKLQRDNQSANARTAEAEAQLADLKTRIAAPPPVAAQKSKVTPTTGGTYELGLQLFHAHKYDEAAGQFQGLLNGGASADIEDNCHYWLGECLYAMKNYKEAISHFNEVFTFKISEKKDDAQMMIANSYLAMGNTEKAKAEYQKLIDKFPASTYVARAKEKLAKL